MSESQFLLELRSSTFCLIPRGLTLWTVSADVFELYTSCGDFQYRLVQAILTNCIPVLVDDGSTVYPFESLIDYDLFSVKITPER